MNTYIHRITRQKSRKSSLIDPSKHNNVILSGMECSEESVRLEIKEITSCWTDPSVLDKAIRMTEKLKRGQGLLLQKF